MTLIQAQRYAYIFYALFCSIFGNLESDAINEKRCATHENQCRLKRCRQYCRRDIISFNMLMAPLEHLVAPALRTQGQNTSSIL